MLVPYGLNQPRIPIKLVVHIKSAQVLVKNETSLISKFKNSLLDFFVKKETSQTESTAIQIENEIDLNPYVKVTFDGVTVNLDLLLKVRLCLILETIIRNKRRCWK